MIEASIDIRCDDGVWADLRIANRGDAVARMHNPGDHRPTEGWEYSREAYQVAVLSSFHFLEMTLRASDGSVIEPEPIFIRADPLVRLPLVLDPGGQLVIPIPLHEFYTLEDGAPYVLALIYGDDDGRVSASAEVRC